MGAEWVEIDVQGQGECTTEQASLSSAGRELFDDPSYVNVQNLDKARQAGGGAEPPSAAINGSVPRDLFDMSECISFFCIPTICLILFLLPISLLLPGFPPGRSGSW